MCIYYKKIYMSSSVDGQKSDLPFLSYLVYMLHANNMQ